VARLLIVLFLAYPLVEIALFVKVGQAVGLLPTLGLVVAAALLGVVVLRRQGLSLMTDIRSTVGRGQLPAQALAEAMMVFLAGLFLLLPGFFTDALGLLLLVPPVRHALYGFLRDRMVVVATGRHGRVQPIGDQTIDLDAGDYRKRDGDDYRLR